MASIRKSEVARGSPIAHWSDEGFFFFYLHSPLHNLKLDFIEAIEARAARNVALVPAAIVSGVRLGILCTYIHT